MTTQGWVMERYQGLVDAFAARGWTDPPPLGDPGSLDAQNVLHAMLGRLTGRPPLVVRRGKGLTVVDAEERQRAERAGHRPRK